MVSREYKEFQSLSKAIAWMRFPLILMIVLLHCFCAIDASSHPLYFSWVYPFGLWLGETGVPAFFFLSGYLFFYSQKTYAEKLQSRGRTLLVPYLFWNVLILLAFAFLEFSGHGMLIAGKSIVDYEFIDYVRAFIDRGQWDRGNGVPMLCPYWYIRNLMILCVLSPVIYYGIKYLKWIPILASFFWWILLPYNGMLASSLLFFCLGAFFSITRQTPIVVLQKYKILFLSSWFVAFLLDWSHCFWNVPFALYVHRVSLVYNVFMLLLIGNYFGNTYYPERKLLDNSTFWIYTVHYPLTIAVGNVANRLLSQSADWQILLFYFLSVIGVIVICVLSYMMLHKWFPRFVSFSTGSRA